MFIRKNRIIFLWLLVWCSNHLYSSEFGALTDELRQHPSYQDVAATVQDLQYWSTCTFNEKGGTPNVTLLHIASQNGHEHVVKLLLQFGARVNATTRNECYSPLFLAAADGHTSTAARLIAAGARVNDKASNGCSPLAIATKKGHGAVVQLLKSSGAQE